MTAPTATKPQSPSKLPGWIKLIMIQTVIIVAGTTLLLEGIVAAGFRYPHASPIPSALLRYLHVRFDRNVIQVMPECAVYDPTLTYTLRPGQCVFASREFSNAYSINSLGVRDDEESLVQPQTVMLGDSLTMGWAVEQQESFPAVFERLTLQRTLNAGVSSYGTVRELRLLERIDRRSLKNIVIQYNANDAGENAQLVERGPFRTLSREQYERTVADQASLLRYFPGKYAFNIVVQFQGTLRQKLRGPQAEEIAVEHQASLFVRVAEQSAVDLSPYRVLVLSTNSRFIDAARTIAAGSHHKAVAAFEFLDAGPAIAQLPDPYYVLDDHPRAGTHAVIAKLLADRLSQPRSLP